MVGPSKSRPPMSHRKTDLGIPHPSKSAKVVLGFAFTQAVSARGSGRLGEPVLDRFLKGEQLLHARPLRHALEMCRAVPEARQIEFELTRSPLTPKEMRVRRREVVKEE